MSKSLQEAEMWYLPLEKVILAIIHTIKKPPHYFQAHTILIITQLPLQALLRKLDFTEKVVKWGTILGAFDINCLPWIVIKEQVLADLVEKFIEGVELGENEENDSYMWMRPLIKKGLGIGIVMISPKHITIKKSLRQDFSVTNNEAEYEALMTGLSSVKKLEGGVNL